MTENTCSCSCGCGCVKFEDRPFELNVIRVRCLNKPYTRHGIVFCNILGMTDSVIGITTFGRIGSNFHSEWIKRDLDKFFQYDKDNEREYKTGKLKLKLKRLKFKIYRMGSVNKPFTRSEKVLGNIFHMIDSIVEIMTFGNFQSNLSHEWGSRELNKLGRYIEMYGVEGLKNNQCK